MIPLTDSEIMLHDSQKVCFLCEKEFCTDKIIKKSTNECVKLEIIVILLVNIVVLHIVHVIYNTKYLGLYRQYFIMALHMIIIL